MIKKLKENISCELSNVLKYVSTSPKILKSLIVDSIFLELIWFTILINVIIKPSLIITTLAIIIQIIHTFNLIDNVKLYLNYKKKSDD